METQDLIDEGRALDAMTTVDDILIHHAETRPDNTAYFFEGERLTWAGLSGRANRIANGLLSLGIPHQGRVGYIGKNHLNYFEMLAGCARSGHVLCPVNWRLSVYEIAALLEDFDVRFLVIDAMLADHVPHLVEKLDQVKQIVINEGDVADHQEFTAWRDSQPDSTPPSQVSAEDILLQMHTSGTTGVPKGAMHPHRVYLDQARMSRSGELGEWSSNDIVVVPLPIFHVGGTGFASYGYFLGAETVISREASPSFVIDCLKARPATRLGLVPAVMQMMLDSPDFSSDLVKNLTCLNFGGAPITVELLKRTFEGFDCDLSQQFGMTETASMGATLYLKKNEPVDPKWLKSVGRPYKNVQIKIVDADKNEMPQGEAGEIVIKTPTLMAGYYKRPEQTAEVIEDGWYHTGDIGYFDEAGLLYISDRIKDMIITGGENVYSVEVEAMLSTHPDIVECAVIGVPSEKWGEDVMACVVAREGSGLTAEAVVAYSRERIAHFKCPKHVSFVDAIPRNAVGKSLKRVLREPYWADRDRAI